MRAWLLFCILLAGCIDAVDAPDTQTATGPAASRPAVNHASVSGTDCTGYLTVHPTPTSHAQTYLPEPFEAMPRPDLRIGDPVPMTRIIYGASWCETLGDGDGFPAIDLQRFFVEVEVESPDGTGGPHYYSVFHAPGHNESLRVALDDLGILYEDVDSTTFLWTSGHQYQNVEVGYNTTSGNDTRTLTLYETRADQFIIPQDAPGSLVDSTRTTWHAMAGEDVARMVETWGQQAEPGGIAQDCHYGAASILAGLVDADDCAPTGRVIMESLFGARVALRYDIDVVALDALATDRPR